MALRDMAELVTKHGRHFIRRAYRGDQPQMQAKIAARQGESVDAPVTNQGYLPGKPFVELGMQLAARTRGRHQRQPDTLDVVSKHRVIDIVRIPVNAGGNTVANAALGRGGQL